MYSETGWVLVHAVSRAVAFGRGGVANSEDSKEKARWLGYWYFFRTVYVWSKIYGEGIL